MNLREAILSEHSRAQADKIVAYVGEDKKRFAHLMELFFEGEYRITQRAGWPMSDIARKHPELFEPYLEQAIAYLGRPNIHPAIIRNVLRILQGMRLNEEVQGHMFDICFSYVQDPKQAGAIKAFSITVLKNICKAYPDLAKEVSLVLKERLPYEKPSFKVRAKDFLNTFPS